MSRWFGPVRQNGYVVRDIEREMRHWIEWLGVGPFFYIDHQPMNDFHYQGRPGNPVLSIALAYAGGLQIELIQQRDDQPSAFRSFVDSGREGLQHVAFWTTTFDEHLAAARGRGLEVLQSGCSGSGAPDERFVYLAAKDRPDSVIELSETTGRKGVLFRAVEEASEGWDGYDPIRDMSTLLERV